MSAESEARAALIDLALHLHRIQETTWSEGRAHVVVRVTPEQFALMVFAIGSFTGSLPAARRPMVHRPRKVARLPELTREEAAILDTKEWLLFGMAPGIRCRVCACSDDDCSSCIVRTGNPCHWVQPGLCSACATYEDPSHVG